jgi:hypothetical protein
MKDSAKGILLLFGVTILFLIWFAFTSYGTLLIQKFIYPEWLSVQRLSVESSKSYVDSNNLALSNLITEFVALDVKIMDAGGDQNSINVYKAQQGAIKNQMCQTVSKMKSGTVSPMTLQFISQNGGCY